MDKDSSSLIDENCKPLHLIPSKLFIFLEVQGQVAVHSSLHTLTLCICLNSDVEFTTRIPKKVLVTSNGHRIATESSSKELLRRQEVQIVIYVAYFLWEEGFRMPAE